MADALSPEDVVIDSPTEERNLRTCELDAVPTLELLQMINAEDQLVPGAVAAVLGDLARLVDDAVARVLAGGRVHYVGAGTSGRLGVLDAAELLPTFNLEPGVVVAHMAGGVEAMFRALEDAEDDDAAGVAALDGVVSSDVVIGISASGRTPYVVGALRRAREVGTLSALITANPRSQLRDAVDVALVLDTGPEALTGSTRLKAATAQKLVLHSFSTALMVRLGRTWSNLMVSMVATNQKLRARTMTILEEATGADRVTCERLLEAAGGDLKVALITALWDASPAEARAALVRSGGQVRKAGTLVVGATPDSPSQLGQAHDGRNT